MDDGNNQPRPRLSLPTRPGQFPREHQSPQPANRPAQADSVVYLVQEPSIPKVSGRPIDITPLLWHGKVTVIMERTQTASYRPDASYIQISKRLEGFRPDRDFIAIAGGDSLANVLVGVVLAQMGHKYFYYLRFERTRLPDGSRDPSNGQYVPVYVPLCAEAALHPPSM